MSGSAKDQPNRGNEPPVNDSSPDASAYETPSETEEAAWLEVEAELSRPSRKAVGSVVVQEMEHIPASSVARLKGVDPHSPLIMVETAFWQVRPVLSGWSIIISQWVPCCGFFFHSDRPHLSALGKPGCLDGSTRFGLLLSVLMGPARSILYVMPYGLLGVLLGVFGAEERSGAFLCSQERFSVLLDSSFAFG